MIGTDTMGTTDQALTYAQALAHTDEPTADMLAASAAEVVEPAPVALGPSEELSGGAGAMYLREIANHDLLSAQDEVQLARRMEAGREAARRLASEEPLDAAERERLRRVVADSERARRHLIECNLRLVVSVARRYMNRGLSFLDLVQEGNIRLPVHAVELLTRVRRAERELQAATGQAPSLEAVAAHLGLEIERILEAWRAAQVPLSIEAPLGDDTGLTRGDMLGDEGAAQAAARQVESRELSQRLAEALELLDPRERKILMMRFGLERGQERTLSEVAEVIGVSRERIRQIEQAALSKLRRMPGLRNEVLEYLAA